jgi:solute:Na+ symporter, SSS family
MRTGPAVSPGAGSSVSPKGVGRAVRYTPCPVSAYDVAIIGFYLVFLVALGWVFRRLNRDTSDYFRCGGAMPWWITGVSAWIAGFSAWTFTGAAGKIYETGTLVLGLYYAQVPPLIIVLLYTGYRFRRMRVVTWMEAVRQRFGRPTEQFYTWVKIPLALLFGGLGLNAIAVFMSAVFGVHVAPALVVLGTAITLVALTGGAWAVLASDFVQMLLVVTITLTAAFLALRAPAVGGLHGLIRQVPHAYLHWADLARLQGILLWVVGLFAIKLFDANNLENSTVYLMVKNDRDARRMVLIPLIGFLIAPLVWLIPPMVARVTHPNLAAEYAQLPRPAEAAFVAAARDVMPPGMMALLMCAMFGATLTATDVSLNKNAGVFVRNFYRPVLDPGASEKRMLTVGKICTAAFGAAIVGLALLIDRYRSSGLFDLTNQIAASLAFPLMIPLAYGLLFKRTPGWSGWSTALVGFAASCLVQFVISPEGCMRRFGAGGHLSDRERSDFYLYATVAADVIAGTLWFAASSLFYRASSSEHRARVDRFFENLKTPIDPTREHVANYDPVLYRLIGSLCLVYGAFVLLLVLIPNPPTGRLCFAFCGGAIFLTGALLLRLGRRNRVDLRSDRYAETLETSP